ncbi:MAG: alpha-L-arabinofuranosidase C-terminal domain-containing protein [Tepidisphaeraceae bacterium]
MTRFLLVLSCALSSSSIAQAAPASANPTLTINAANAAHEVSPLMYGLMTEEINHSYDGGLYAELVRNRAFLDDAQQPVQWSVIQGSGSAATISLDPQQPLSEVLKTSLRLEVSRASAQIPAGVANSGYWGIPVQPDTRYRASFYAKAAPGFAGALTLAIQSTDGRTVYARAQVDGLTGQWKRYEAVLQTASDVLPTTQARFTLTVDQPGTIWLDLVSLFPPTWNDQPNGFRKDLMQMLVDLHPKFLRFPGGAFLEGSNINQRFQWKKTIGPLTGRPGHAGLWGYRASDGMGLLEFVQWCQDMGAEPVMAVYAGYCCDDTHVDPGPQLQPFVQDALDEIEYVTGDAAGTRWGAQRARDGHPEAFTLHYVEIGNEDFFDKSNSYDGRFAQFYDAIKSKYPQIKVISSVGNENPLPLLVHSRAPDVVDEHYYRAAEDFIKMSPAYYEAYARNTRPEIFVGEWASYEDPKTKPWDPGSKSLPRTPNFKAALGDAAWMTAMERNSDLVVMNCYAPLLVNVNPGASQWRPDLIGYDALHAFGSPSYYAIRMFSTNLGDECLAIAVSASSVQASATRDSRTGEIFLKMVNPTPVGESLQIQLDGINSVQPTATALTMAADPTATNSLDHPTAVIPVTSTVPDVKPLFVWHVSPNSISVLTIKTR